MKKLIIDQFPSDLENLVRSLVTYPQSLRLGNELWNTGLGHFKKNSLYLPLIPYEAFLRFKDRQAIFFKRSYAYFLLNIEIGALIRNGDNKIATSVLKTPWGITSSKIIMINEKNEETDSRVYNLI